MVVKKINPLSAAKVAGVLYAMMGLVFGALISLFSLAGGLATGLATDDSPFAMGGAMLGVGAIVIFPILYGILGAIVVAIGAVLYNVAAGMVGGLEIDMR